MDDASFNQVYSEATRVASMRAAAVAARYKMPADYRLDLEQEALLELWLKYPAYDSRRGGWRTFAERLVANRMASLLRSMRSERAGYFREDPLDESQSLAAPHRDASLAVDVYRVLHRVSPFDRQVARGLVDHSAVEISRYLGVSRATVYRALGRLQAAFVMAGYSRREPGT